MQTVYRLDQQYAKALVAGGNEAFNRWQVIEPDTGCRRQRPCRETSMLSGTPLRKAFEQTASHWHYIDQYLSDFRQEPDESTADLDLRIQELVKGCKFPDNQVETRKLELLFHATNLFLIHEHIVDTPNVTYAECIKKAKQHERTVVRLQRSCIVTWCHGLAQFPHLRILFLQPMQSSAVVKPTGRQQGGTCGEVWQVS